MEKQALADSLRNSSSKQHFRIFPGVPIKAINKDSTIDILLESFQNCSEQLFFTGERVLLQIQQFNFISFFKNDDAEIYKWPLI